MARRQEFRSARTVREPLVAVFDDGREIEFPGDLEAGLFLEFVEKHGDHLATDSMPLDVIGPFMRTVLGARYEDVKEQLSVSEMNDVAGWLWIEYIVAASKDAGGEAAAKALASMTSSMNGDSLRPTSGASTE